MTVIKSRNASGLSYTDESTLKQEGMVVSKDKRTGRAARMTALSAQIGTPEVPGDLLLEGNISQSYDIVKAVAGST